MLQQHMPPTLPLKNLHVQNIHRLKDELYLQLETVFKRNKTFAIIDEFHAIGNRKEIKHLFTPSIIEHDTASRVLYLKTPFQEIEPTSPLNLFTGTEYIYDPNVLSQKFVQKGINRLSPSHGLLQ